MSQNPHSASRQLAGARRKARHFAVQALYQWALSANNIPDIERQFLEDFDFQGVDLDYFEAILHGVPARLAGVEALLVPYLDIPLEKLGPVERAILRMSAWELMERIDVPWRVVIDEAIALTRKFGATDAHKFVNGVLDKVAHEVRSAEVAAGR